MNTFFCLLAFMFFTSIGVANLLIGWKTSGRINRFDRLGDLIVLVVLYGMFLVMMSWSIGFSYLGTKMTFVSVIFALFVQIGQYVWFVGPMSSIRKRRISRLREKWKEELRFIEAQNKNLCEEAKVMADLTPSVRDQNSRHNAWLADQNRKRELYLLEKLRNVY